MAGMLAMLGGSLVSGLAGPLLAQFPNIPGAAITNPYAGMTSTGGNSVGAPIIDMFGNFLGTSSGSRTGVQSYYIETPSTATSSQTTTTSPIDTNTLLIGGAVLLAIVLIK